MQLSTQWTTIFYCLWCPIVLISVAQHWAGSGPVLANELSLVYGRHTTDHFHAVTCSIPQGCSFSLLGFCHLHRGHDCCMSSQSHMYAAYNSTTVVLLADVDSVQEPLTNCIDDVAEWCMPGVDYNSVLIKQKWFSSGRLPTSPNFKGSVAHFKSGHRLSYRPLLLGHPLILQ